MIVGYAVTEFSLDHFSSVTRRDMDRHKRPDGHISNKPDPNCRLQPIFGAVKTVTVL